MNGAWSVQPLTIALLSKPKLTGSGASAWRLSSKKRSSFCQSLALPNSKFWFPSRPAWSGGPDVMGSGGDRFVTIQIVAKAPVPNRAIKNNSNNTSAPTTLAGRSGGTKVFGRGGGFGFSSFGAASVVISTSFTGVCGACAAVLEASSGGAVDGAAAGGDSGATTDGSVAPVFG